MDGSQDNLLYEDVDDTVAVNETNKNGNENNDVSSDESDDYTTDVEVSQAVYNELFDDSDNEPHFEGFIKYKQFKIFETLYANIVTKDFLLAKYLFGLYFIKNF